jgi:hypothetical protein
VARGAPKLVERVSELTFDRARAVRQGKTVLYVTHTGVFRLTSDGLELASVVPGIDVQRDILDFVPMKIGRCWAGSPRPWPARRTRVMSKTGGGLSRCGNRRFAEVRISVRGRTDRVPAAFRHPAALSVRAQASARWAHDRGAVRPDARCALLH